MKQQLSYGDQYYGNEEMSSVDLRYLFFVLLHKSWIIFVCMALFGTVASIISVYYLEPVYSASSTIYVYRQVESPASVLSELNTGTQLVKDSAILLKSNAVLSNAITMVGVDLTADELSKKMSARIETETRILKVSVIDGNPNTAADLTNAITKSFLNIFHDLTQSKTKDEANINNEYINIVDKAYPNPVPIKPNKKLIVLMSMMLGVAIGIGIIFLTEYLDDTIKYPESIELQHGLEVIGIVPTFDYNRNR